MKKRSIKKVLALGLAGAMLCGMLTACGGANGSSSAPSASSEGQAEPAAPETEKEKVVLWHLWTGVEAGYLDDAVAAYNAQSDKYYVEALSVPDSQKIMVAIQSGDGPDITDDFTNNITSLGGVVLDAPGDSDCMLAVNSPGKHMIESVEQYTKDLTFSTHLNLNELFRYMRYYHEEYGRPVGLAEVSVANGCENDCMELGLLTGTYDYLTAVGGWNTAQNTIGVVLAQLVIASYYNGFCGRPEQLRRSEEFMASRLASDWLYQSNVLHRYLVETAGTVDPYALGRHYGDAAEYFRHGLQALLDEKFTAGIRGRRPIVDTLQFQWDGIFYIRLHVRLEEVLRAEGTKEKTDTGE